MEGRDSQSSFRGARKAGEPGIQRDPRSHLDSGFAPSQVGCCRLAVIGAPRNDDGEAIEGHCRARSIVILRCERADVSEPRRMRLPGPFILRGSLCSHLRMTGMDHASRA